MKLVINKCYGGFGLSLLAQKRYLELIGKKAFFYKQTKYSFRDGADEFGRIDDIEKYTSISSETYTEDKGDTFKPTKRNLEGYWYYGNLKRDDPILVRVVEELGSELASGGCAHLKVVDIPDDIEYEINEYDGIESVREAHRSW